MRIGPYQLRTPLILAPMAGVTDHPFRQLCLRLGAGMAVSEMVYANPALRGTRKSDQRLSDDHHLEPEPRAVQIAGTDPRQMADFARENQARGAQIIDINMGCPAKKVCAVAAGSALMRDEGLVREILEAVVEAVTVPVTLKTRTGWDQQNRNVRRIAEIAEKAGVAALTVHGRTRADAYVGDAEYQTIADVKRAVSIPVIANGDIDSPEKAKRVLEATGADALMIARAAQGNPWIFREIGHYLATGDFLAPPDQAERRAVLLEHVAALHRFYGEFMGVRIARKHIRWYTRAQPDGEDLWGRINRVEGASDQLSLLDDFFHSRRVAA